MRCGGYAKLKVLARNGDAWKATLNRWKTDDKKIITEIHWHKNLGISFGVIKVVISFVLFTNKNLNSYKSSHFIVHAEKFHCVKKLFDG